MKTSFFVLISLIGFLSISLHQCGHIYSQPSEIVPQNAQAAKTFHFFFMLETQLAAGDYLFIKFPMLVTTASAKISTSMDPSVEATITTTARADAAVSTTESRFFALSQALSANTWYRVVVTITDASSQAVGVQGCVWFATTSSYSTSAAPTYITYDENRCFDVLSFAPTIDTTNFKVTGYYLFAAANTYKTISGTYNANFDITPSQNVGLPGATFVLTLGGTFTFTGTCTSISCTSNDGSAGDYCPLTNLTALPSSAYTCTISSTSANTLTLVINQAVITNTTRIQVGIQAPSAYVASAQSISATFKSSKAPIIFATTAVTSGSVNGIDLRTDFTTLSLTGTQKLLWGAVPTGVVAGRSSGYSGCPIVLYASGATVKVFNSLQTSFTLTTAIKKMTANTGIQAIWTLMDGSLSLVDQLLLNSLYTTMPGTIVWAYSSDVVTVTGITDLSATSYSLGVKFSIDVASNPKAAALSTVTGPSTQNVGGVSIKTGDNSKTFATISATQISIKKNMEYQDLAVQNTGDGVVKLYNQVFSYWVDNTKYIWTDKVAGTTGAQEDALTFKKYFLGQVASIGSAAAVWPKPSGATNNQALLIQLKFVAAAVCLGSGTDYLSITLLANCAVLASPYTVQIGVLLKVVFNNGLLNIPEASFIYGAKVIGTLFPGANPGTNYLVYDDTRTSTTGPIGNTIIKDTTGNFWHLSISCFPQAVSGADTSCFSATTYVSTATPASTDTFSALAFINTNIAKYPTLYADAYVLDFIVCFKIAGTTVAITRTATTSAPLESANSGNAQWQLVEEGCSGTASGSCTVTAGPGLINGYVISGMVDTTVKTSLVNGYVTDAPAYASGDTTTFVPFIPAYLRLGVTITSPVASASALGFFIGGTSLYTGLSTYATAGVINIIDTVGSATTAILGKGASYAASLVDQWWAHNCLLISGSVSSGTASTLNYYVPIQTSFASIDSLNIAFLGTQSNGQYPVNAVYRVFGAIVSNNILLASPTYVTVGATLYHLVSEIAAAGAAHSSSFLGTTSGITIPLLYWDASIGAGTTTGCFSGVQTPSTAPQMNPGTGQSILPSKSLATGFYILTDVANPTGILCNVGAGNTGSYTIINTGPATKNTWGEAFIVYVRESTNIFSSSTPTWDYAGTNTNKCYFHTVVYSSSNIFTIFCTTDFYASAAFGTGSKKLNLASFTVPFHWGQNYVIKTKINYAWSSIDGTIASFNGEKALTSGWTYTGCTASDSLSLAATSMDVPITITLTSSNGVTYNVAAGKTLSLTISSSASSFYSECTHASLSCSISSLVISLTNSGTTAVSVPGSSIIVSGWVDTGVTASAATYNVQIAYDSGSLIETCAAASGGGFQVSGTALVNVVTLSSFSYMANQGARGVWSFSFSYPRIIRNGYDFALNVGALAGPTTGRDVANYRCMILQNGAVSNAWSTLTSISSSTFVSTVTTKTLFASGGTFTYKCLGGASPDSSVAFTNLATGTVERSGGAKVTASSIPTANQYTVPTPSAAAATLSTVSLTKFFNTRGFESDYIFSFIPAAANITTSGRIVVEFSQSISPKFNRFGRVDCFLNETPVFCENPLGTERRVQVWPNMVLSTVQTYSYVLRIAGVTQPNSLGANDADSNKKIFFALSSGSDPSAGLTEQAFLTETWDASLSSATIASILIHDFSYQVSKIRSSTSFTYVLNFPASTFTTAGAVLWVQLPPSVVRSIFYGSSPSFTFVRVGDSTSTNIVSTSAVLRAGRVAVAMKADAINAVSCNYTLTINGIATPQIPPQTGFVRDDFRIYVADSTNTTVLSSTASGSRNTSTYISWNTGSYSAAQLLFWYDPNGNQVNMVDVSVGTYQTLIFLSASMNTFTNTFTFSINGGNSSAFLTAPKDPNYPVRTNIGSTQAPVYIAAKTGTTPGAYYVSWLSGDTSGYSPIQNLDLRVVSTNCTPSLVSNTFDVPFGGTSDPIIVDFSRCIPVSDVTILANVTSGFNMTNPLGISLSNQQTQSSSLAWSNMNGNYRVSFYAVSQQGSNGTNTAGAATISFTMSGTNGANINSPGTVTINLVQASTVAPVPLTPTISGSTLSVGCDQSGSNFFALATFTNAAGYNLTYINSQTQAVNVPLTSPAEKDAAYTVFGYVAGLVPPALSNVNLAGYLKAGANLTVFSYCQSNSYVASNNASSLNWLQPDNGGSTVVLKATFKAPLTSNQKVSMACALVKNLLIKSNRVQTDEGKWCTTLRVLQNTTNTTNTTTTTTTNTTANTTQNATYSTYFYILKDYLASNDSAGSSVQANILSSTYLPSLISSIGDSSFPAVSSVYMTGTVVNVTTNANGQTIIPVVNYNSSVTDTVSINATFTLTNMNGVIYAGVEPNVNTSSIPNATNLIQGLNGNGVALTTFNYSIATQNVPVTVSLTNLTNNTQYLLYYVANNLDISYNGLYSAVVNITVSTNAPSSSFGSVISISMMVLAAVFLALFGMI